MRELIRKQPLMNKEFIPVAMAQMQKSQERVRLKIDALIEAERLKEQSSKEAPRK